MKSVSSVQWWQKASGDYVRTRRVARHGGSMWPCIRHPQSSIEVKVRLGGAHGLSALHHDLTLAVALGQPKQVRRLLVALLII